MSGVSRRTIANAETGIKISRNSERHIIEGLGFDYGHDREWIFPGPKMSTAVVQVEYDVVRKIMNVGNPKELQQFGLRVLETLLNDGYLCNPIGGPHED